MEPESVGHITCAEIEDNRLASSIGYHTINHEQPREKSLLELHLFFP